MPCAQPGKPIGAPAGRQLRRVFRLHVQQEMLGPGGEHAGAVLQTMKQELPLSQRVTEVARFRSAVGMEA